MIAISAEGKRIRVQFKEHGVRRHRHIPFPAYTFSLKRGKRTKWMRVDRAIVDLRPDYLRREMQRFLAANGIKPESVLK